MRLVTSKLRVSMAAGTMLRQGAPSHLSSFFPHRTQFPFRWSEFRSSIPPASVACNKWVVCRPVLHFKLSRPASSGELHNIDNRIHNMVKVVFLVSRIYTFLLVWFNIHVRKLWMCVFLMVWCSDWIFASQAHSTRAVEVTKKCLEIQLTITPAQISDSFSESSSILDNGLEDIVDMEDDESVLESVDLVMSAPEEVCSSFRDKNSCKIVFLITLLVPSHCEFWCLGCPLLSCHKIFLECSLVVWKTSGMFLGGWGFSTALAGDNSNKQCVHSRCWSRCLRCSCCHQVWRPRCSSWGSWVVL